MVVALTTLKLKENTPNVGGAGFDLAGAATLSLALASTLVVLTLGGMFGWVSAPTIMLAGLSVVMLLLFLRD